MFPYIIHSGQPFSPNIKTGTAYSVGEIIQKDMMEAVYKILYEKSRFRILAR